MPKVGFCIAMMWASMCLAQAGPATVVVAPVERRTMDRTQPLVASVEPVTRTTLATEEPGLVAERLFDEGQRVEMGALLVRTNVELLEVQRAAAAAARDSSLAMIDRAKADADQARREHERQETLRKRDVGSEKELQDALALDKGMTAMMGVRAAELAERNAELARLDLQIKKSQVHSPFRAMVSRRHVEVGQWIKQGDAVAELVQLDPLFVRVNVPEGVVSAIREGDEATVIIDALGGKTFTGKVAQILPEADPASRTFPVKIQVANPDMAIRPGFFARAVLSIHTTVPTFVVPRDALVTRDEKHHVVAIRDGKATIVPVTRSAAAGEKVSVSGELKESDQVVIRGNEPLRGGEPVMAIPSK